MDEREKRLLVAHAISASRCRSSTCDPSAVRLRHAHVADQHSSLMSLIPTPIEDRKNNHIIRNMFYE